MTVDGLDLDTGLVLVMGKGRKERWIPLGAKALEELWEYLLQREQRVPDRVKPLWVASDGSPLKPVGIYRAMKTLDMRL